MANLKEGDRVSATENLGTGATKGTKGTVTHIAIHHGLVSVRFDTGKELKAVKPHQVTSA